MGLDIKEGSWPILPVFQFLEKYGKVDHREMFNIYNMGIGMVIALDNLEDAKKTIDILAKYGDKAYVIGEITNNAGKVVIHK
jgi:phosphoribosylformylglycinamidine cyclo-ligase